MKTDWLEQAIAHLDAQSLEELSHFMGLTQPPAEGDLQTEDTEKQSLESKRTPAE